MCAANTIGKGARPCPGYDGSLHTTNNNAKERPA